MDSRGRDTPRTEASVTVGSTPSRAPAVAVLVGLPVALVLLVAAIDIEFRERLVSRAAHGLGSGIVIASALILGWALWRLASPGSSPSLKRAGQVVGAGLACWIALAVALGPRWFLSEPERRNEPQTRSASSLPEFQRATQGLWDLDGPFTDTAGQRGCSIRSSASSHNAFELAFRMGKQQTGSLYVIGDLGVIGVDAGLESAVRNGLTARFSNGAVFPLSLGEPESFAYRNIARATFFHFGYAPIGEWRRFFDAFSTARHMDLEIAGIRVTFNLAGSANAVNLLQRCAQSL